MKSSEIKKIFQRTSRNFIQYWFEYLSRQETDFPKLDIELANIWQALQQAKDQGEKDKLVTAVHQLYLYCESRGLYEQINPYLHYIHKNHLGDGKPFILNLLYLGRVSMRQHQYEASKTWWETGLGLSQDHHFQVLTCEFKKELGSLAIEQQAYDQARIFLIQSLFMVRQMQLSIAQKFHLMCKIEGELCRLYYLQGNYQKAKRYGYIGLKHAYMVEEEILLTGLAIYLGAIEIDTDNTKKAYDTLLDGLIVGRRIGHLERNLYLLTNLGEAATTLGLQNEAESFLLEGIQIARQLGNSQVLSHQLLDLGVLCGQRGKRDKAKSAVQESMALAEQTEHLPLITYNLMKLGAFFLNQGDTAAALQTYQKCVDRIDPSNAPNKLQIRRAMAQYGMAQALYDSEEYIQSNALCHQCLAVLKQKAPDKARKVEAWLAETNIDIS